MGVHRTILENHENDVSTLAVDVLGTAVEIAAPPALLGELRAVLADLEPASGADRRLALVPGERGFDLWDDGRIVRPGVEPADRRRHGDLAPQRHCRRGDRTRADPWGVRGRVRRRGGTASRRHRGGKVDAHRGVRWCRARVPVRRARRAGPCHGHRRALSEASEPRRGAPRPCVVARSGGEPDRRLRAPSCSPVTSPVPKPARRRLDPAWALLALAAHASNLAALGHRALVWLAGVALTCPARQLTYGDAAQVVTAIERAAETPHRPVAPADTLPPVTEDTTTVAMGDSLAVFHQPSRMVHVLNRSAAAMWRRAAAVEASDSLSLVDAVLETGGGEQPDRSTATATIDRLVRSGLLPAAAGT